jgi:hypothetical protein
MAWSDTQCQSRCAVRLRAQGPRVTVWVVKRGPSSSVPAGGGGAVHSSAGPFSAEPYAACAEQAGRGVGVHVLDTALCVLRFDFRASRVAAALGA